MRPPDLPGGNRGAGGVGEDQRQRASMRPPDLPGGNVPIVVQPGEGGAASMRPPDLPGGNLPAKLADLSPAQRRFNEAAGFTRRKPARYRRG